MVLLRVMARRRRAFVWAWGLSTVLLLVAAPAWPRDDIDRLAQRLAAADDFRVRTQAALALGASKNKRAVAALCKGLEDPNATVRAAASAALGRLALGGRECLEKRLRREKITSVKSVMANAIARIEGHAGTNGGPALSAATRYYIAIGETTDKTGRPRGEVDAIVRAAMIEAAGSLEGYAVAPSGEGRREAEKRLAEFKQVKAFFLWPKVQEPQYSGGNLTIRLEVSIFTYPGKALKGAIPLKLTMPDVGPRDRASENELIVMASKSAMERFAANVGRMD